MKKITLDLKKKNEIINEYNKLKFKVVTGSSTYNGKRIKIVDVIAYDNGYFCFTLENRKQVIADTKRKDVISPEFNCDFKVLEKDFLILHNYDYPSGNYGNTKSIFSLKSFEATSFEYGSYSGPSFDKLEEGYYLISYNLTFPLFSVGEERMKIIRLEDLETTSRFTWYKNLTNGYYVYRETVCCEDCGRGHCYQFLQLEGLKRSKAFYNYEIEKEKFPFLKETNPSEKELKTLFEV